MLGKSKKFSTAFGHSIAILLLITGITVIGVFIIFLQNQAQENVIKETTFKPSTCTGWENADNARTISLPSNATSEKFSSNNSALSQSSDASSVDNTAQNLPSATENFLVCSGFLIDENLFTKKDVRSVQVELSVAVKADAATQDVLTIEYSPDGSTWNQLESMIIEAEMSNYTHDGYFVYDITGAIPSEELEHVQVRVTHHGVLLGASRVFVDGIALQLGLQKKLAIPELPSDIVRMAKLDFSLNESPTFYVKTEDRSIFSFLGDTKVRTVNRVDLIAPDGSIQEGDVSFAMQKSGMDSEQYYTLKTKNFSKPGLYKLKVHIAQDGVEQIIEQPFWWGALGINVRTSIGPPVEHTEVSIGLVDEVGRTICDGDIELDVVNPNGNVQRFSTSDSTIVVNETCVDKSVTNEPDYSALVQTLEEGTYSMSVVAHTTSGDHVIQDAFVIDADVSFIITRSEFPTRIYPLADYPVSFSVTPKEHFEGKIIERIPREFVVLDISDGGLVTTEDSDTKNQLLSWDVTLEAQTTYTFEYTFDPPDISPALFILGPITMGDFTESRQWQIASDVAGTAAAETTSTATSERLEGEGRHLVFINNLTGYIFENNSTGAIVFRKTVNGGINWSNAVVITAQTDCENFAIWYDGWTPGNTGGLIHVAFLENGGDTIYYENVNTASSDTQKGEVAVYSDTATTRTSITDSLSIIEATDGDLYIAISSGAANAVSVVMNSDDTGTNWAAVADEGLDDATQDYVMLMPLTNADIFVLRWDVSADDIQSKEYEDGTDAWDAGWTNIDTSAVENSAVTWNETWAATISPISNTIYLAYVDNAGTASATPDIRTAIYDGSSWTAKTNVVTDTNTILGVSIALDANTDDVYVVYNRGTTTVSSPYFKISSDNMATWSTTERGPLANIASNLRAIHTNMVSNEMLGVWVYDDTAADIWYGTIQDVGTISGALLTTNFNGFESQDSVDADATAGTFSYDTTTFRSGEASLRSNPSTATGYVTHTLLYAATGVSDTTTADPDVVQGVVALRVDSGTVINQQTNIISLLGDGTLEFEISINADQTLSITNDADVNGAYALVDNTWYVVAFTANSDLGTALVGIYSSDMNMLYETLDQAQTMLDFDQVTVGISTASTTADIYFDDLIVYGHATVGNFPMLRGDYRIAKMDADSAGTDTAWAGVNCPGGDYLCINEIPTNTANYIQISAIGDETSALESAASAGITGTLMGLRVMNTAQESSTATSSVRAVRVRGRLTVETTAVNITTTWTEYARVFNVTELQLSIMGASITPIDLDDLDTFQVGVGSDTDPGAPNIQNGDTVTQVIFAPPKILVSGKIYTDEGSTAYNCSSDTLTVYAAVNGGTSRGGLCNTTTGNFSVVADPPSAVDDPVAVFIDSGETPKATTVTLASSTTAAISGADMYQDTAIVKHESATAITNAKLATADNTNAGIRYSVSSSNLTVESGIELHVWTGDTYDPGGTITTNATGGDFHVDDGSTASIDTAPSAIGLDILVDGGATLNIDASVTVGGGDITTAGTSATITRTTGSAVTTMRGTGSIGGGTTPSITFYDVTIGDGTTATTTLASSATTTNDVSVGTGSTFNINADLTVNGGDLTNTTTGIINTTSGTPTVTFTTGGNLGGGSGTVTLYNLTTSGTGTTTVASAVIANNDVSVGTGTTLSGSTDLTVGGGDLSGDGTVTFTAGTVTLANDGSVGTNTAVDKDWTFYNVYLDISGACATKDTESNAGTGDIIVTAVLTRDTCDGGGSPAYHYLSTNTRTWIFSGTGTPLEASALSTTGYGTSTVRFTGTGSTVTVGNNRYYNLELQPASSTSYALNNATSYFVYGNLTISSNVSLTAGTSSIYMYGQDTTLDAGGATLNNFYVDPDSPDGTVSIANTDVIISGTFLVWDAGDVLSIPSGRKVSSTSTFATVGTVSGEGTLCFTSTSSGPGTTGTISSLVQYDASSGDIPTGTFDARTYGGAVEFYSNSGSARSVTAPASATPYVFSSSVTTTCASCGGLTLDLENTTDPVVTINGALSIGASTTFLAPSSTTLTLNGNVTNAGTFTSNGATVALSGTSQQIITGPFAIGNGGAFNNLTITNSSGSDPETSPSVIFTGGDIDVAGMLTANTAGVKMLFNPSYAFSITGLNLNGSSGEGNQVYLRSSTPGTKYVFWLSLLSTQTLTYVDAKDADSSDGDTIDATGIGNVNSGNNLNWNFGYVTVSGTVYTDDGVTPYNCTTDAGGQLDIAVSTNGGAQVTGACTASNGTFSINATSPTAADEPIILYISSAESKKATSATLAASTMEGLGMNIYENRLLIDSESGTSMTNALLSTGDNANAGIRYSVSGGALTVESGLGLYVLSGITFVPGGAVTTPATGTAAGSAGDVTLAGILNMAANKLTVGGDFANTGTYTISSGQDTEFSATDSGFTIADGTATFQDVIFNSEYGGWSFSSAVTLSSDLTMTSGVLSGTNDITVNGGDVTGDGMITLTGGTLTLNGTGNFGGNNVSDWTFYNLLLEATTASNTTTTAIGSGNITITNVLTTGSVYYSGCDCNRVHILKAGSKTWQLTAPGTPFVNNGRLEGETSTFKYYHTDVDTAMNVAQANNQTNDYYYNLTLWGSGFRREVTTILPAGTTYVTGNLLVDSDDFGSVLADGTTNNPTLQVTGNLSCGAHAGQSVTTGTGTWTVSGDVYLTYCTFTSTTGNTIIMDGASKTLTSGSESSFYNLTLSGTITLSNETHTISGNAVFSGTVTPGTSVVKMTGSSNTINAGSNSLYDFTVDNSGAGTITTTSSHMTLTHGLTIATDDTLSIGSALLVNWTGSTFSMQSSSVLSGSGSLNVNSATTLGEVGTITAKVIFDTSAGNTAIMPDRPSYGYGGLVEVFNESSSARTLTIESGTTTIADDLTVNNTSSGTLALAGAANNPTVSVTGDIAFSGSGTRSITSGTGTWTVSGDVNFTGGTYTATTGNTLKMNGTLKTLTTASNSLYNYETSGGTVSMSGATTVTNDVTISGGTLTGPTGVILTVGGNWANTGGTFTPSTSTVLFTATDTGNTINANTSAFNNIVFDGSGGEWTMTSALAVNGTYSLTTGTFVQAADADVTVYGNFTLSSGTTFTAASGTGKLILDGNPLPNTFIDNTSPQQDMGNVEIGLSPGTTDLGSDMIAKTLTVNAGDTLNTNGYDLNIGIGGITIKGIIDADDDVEVDGTQMDTDGIFDLQAGGELANSADSTLTFTMPVTLVDIANDLKTDGTGSLYHLVVNDGGGAHTLTVNVQDPLDVNNDLTITGGVLDAVDGASQINIGGDWTNNDTFEARTGTVVADGTSQQTFSGTMTGSSAFYALTITNSSGADPDTSPSVIFTADAETDNAFTAATANTKLRFDAGNAYTFETIDFDGQATGTRVFLRSSTPGTQWDILVAGARSVSNTDVRDSNACDQAPDIDATDGTNRDSTHNDCWSIDSLTFSISDTTIGFGSLTTANARFATGDNAGADYPPAVAAHTLSVATNATSGYVMTYVGPTLTRGGDLISAATITGDEDGTPGVAEQFAISFSTNGDATIAPTYAKASNNYNFNPSATTTFVSEAGSTATETISCYYIGNIVNSTEAGSYTTDLTYIVTSTF